MKSIYVGNLSYSATETEVREMFEQYGTVNAVRLITDRDTGRARGFGFVEMDDREAEAAIAALNGAEIDGRTLRVNEAQPREGGMGGGNGMGGGRPGGDRRRSSGPRRDTRR